MIKTLRTLGWVIWLFAFMLVRWPKYWWGNYLVKHGRANEMRRQMNRRVSSWSHKLLRHIKVDLTVEGWENLPPSDEAVLFVCNHQSYVDIPVLLGAIEPPPPLLAQRGLGKVPFLSGWMRQLGCIFVQRDDARAAAVAIHESQEVLKSGRSLVVFPEGTRSKKDAMGPFRPGSVRIATKVQAPIIPVVIDGTFRALEGNGYRVSSKKVPVRLSFLPRVETAGLTKEEQRVLTARLEALIRTEKEAELL